MRARKCNTYRSIFGITMHTTNKDLRRYEELMKNTGCCITGRYDDVHFHHFLGRKAKHNKQHIGGHFGIPLHTDLHLVTGSHPLAYHKSKRAFIEEFGQPRDLWRAAYDRIDYYIHDDIVDAIMSIYV